ncbi:MAG: alpha/beta hydrolase [Vicinamibacterales bacterium]
MPWLLFLVSTALALSSVWIIVPAPAIWAVMLSVGGSELSPLFLIASIIAGVLGWHFGGRMHVPAMVLAAIATVLFALPILQYPRDAAFSLRRLLMGLEKNDAQVHRGITPGAPSDPSLTVDVYQPPTGDHHPVLVQIYGGAWQRGAPGDNAAFARYFASRGYTVFAIDYRHAPAAHWPAQIEDVRAALAWVRAHAADYRADATRLAIIGRSSGAQLAMIAGFDDPGVSAVIDYYGPVNLTRAWHEPPRPDPIGSRSVLEAYLGGTPDQLPEPYTGASPIEHLSARLPPTLLIYGLRDHIVQAKYGRDLHAHLIAAGATSQFVEIPWADHAFDAIPGGLSGQLSLWYTEQFLERTLRR